MLQVTLVQAVIFVRMWTFCCGTTHNLQMYLVSLRFLCAAHTFHWVAGYFVFPSPLQTVFSSLFILKSLESLPRGLYLGSLCVVCFCGIWRSSQLDSLQFCTSDIQDLLPHAGRSCTLLFYLYLVSCTEKIRCRAHSLADKLPLFSTILQFLSELSKNWGTGLPFLCRLWICCTGQQHKASFFTCLFSCLSFLCLQLLRHGS